ncbi:MAG: GNAT family N-acetyltransferase [Bacteroidota bacterium]
MTNSPVLSPEHSAISLRELTTFEEYIECVNIQKETWGEAFEEWVPTAVLKVSQKVGGIVAAAYDQKDRMLGFVFGLTGMKDGLPVHWSHMLAVRKEARGQGVGKRLKLYQRDLLLARGVRVAYWTFDPLVAKNANLNLNGLGALVSEYVKDMYLHSSSNLHFGMSMDRFIVAWHLDSEHVQNALARRQIFDAGAFLQTPVVNTQQESDGSFLPVERELRSLPHFRVEIPSNIEEIKSQQSALAVQWRANTRRLFFWCQEHDYSVQGFYIDPNSKRYFYCLARPAKDSGH